MLMRKTLSSVDDYVLQVGDCSMRVPGYGFELAVQDLVCLPEQELLIADGLGHYQLITADHGTGELIVRHQSVKGVPFITTMY